MSLYNKSFAYLVAIYVCMYKSYLCILWDMYINISVVCISMIIDVIVSIKVRLTSDWCSDCLMG